MWDKKKVGRGQQARGLSTPNPVAGSPEEPRGSSSRTFQPPELVGARVAHIHGRRRPKFPE